MKLKTLLKDRSNLILFAFSIIITIIILANEFIFPINKYFTLLIIIGFLIFAKDEFLMVSLLMFLIPFYNALPNNLITLAFVIVFILKHKLNRISFKHIIFVLLVLLYELLHFIFEGFSLYNYLIYSSYIILFFVFINCNNFNRDEYKKIGIIFGLSLILSCIVVLMKMMTIYTIPQILANGLRLGIIEAEKNSELSLTINPNTIAVFCVVAIGINLFDYRITLSKWFLIITLTIFGSLTLSRNFLLSMIILILFIFLFGEKKKKLHVATLVIMITLIIVFFLPEVFVNYFDRFNVDDISNQRIMINGEYFMLWSNSLLYIFFGSGLQNYQNIYGVFESVHNATLEILICWGIIGTMIFVIAIVFNLLYKNRKPFSKNVLILLLTYIISIQSIRLLTTPELLLLLGFILMYRNFDNIIPEKSQKY